MFKTKSRPKLFLLPQIPLPTLLICNFAAKFNRVKSKDLKCL